MYEHYENYDRYIPDVMLKKHKKHEEYLSNAYAGMSHEEIYKSKLAPLKMPSASSRAATASSGPSTAPSPVCSCATSTALLTASTPRTPSSCGPACIVGALSIRSTPTPS